MRRILVALATLLSMAAPLAARAEPSGREIMERVDARDDGDRLSQDLEMILIDRRGNQRVRRMRGFLRDQGEDVHSLLFFEAPADVEGTGFLTYDYDGAEREDDQWLYLPELKKTKRIPSSDKSGSFVGSDFSYADFAARELDRYEFRLLKEGRVGDVPVWIVEALPTPEESEETGYTRSILFVRKDNDFVIRAKIWLDGTDDRQKYLDVKKLERIDGIWVATETHMTTKRGRRTLHKTILRASNVRFDQDLPESLFTVRQLEKGL